MHDFQRDFVVKFSHEPYEFGDKQWHMSLTSFVRSAYYFHMHIFYCIKVPGPSTYSYIERTWSQTRTKLTVTRSTKSAIMCQSLQ